MLSWSYMDRAKLYLKHGGNVMKATKKKIGRKVNKAGQVFKYPVIDFVDEQNNPTKLYWSSRNDLGHFGIPKVIFNVSTKTSGVFIDKNGDYAMTQNCAAISGDKEDLEDMQKALLNPEFLRLMKACDVEGKSKYNIEIIKRFKKDFWKEFV